jgi:tetratricopeptide (TPR) repeat protein
MNRILLLAAVFSMVTGCTAIRDLRNDDSVYDEPQFYEKYLNTGSELDARISATLAALRTNPDSPELHNTLGSLLVEKSFPKDAEREFERAINADDDYHPAWYNLGLVRAARGDELGARRAFKRTIDLKPGHAISLFQLGLIEEKREHTDRAIELYAKALTINPALLDVRVNPRILDSRLTHRALLEMYPGAHTRRTMQFQESGTPRPAAAETPSPEKAVSPQADPKNIVTPTAPATDPAMQPPPAPAAPPKAKPAAPAAPATPQARPTAALPPRERPATPPATSTAPPED